MDRIKMMEMVRAVQCGHMDRRTFLKQATLVVGSAAALKLLAACSASPATPPPPVVEESPQSDDMSAGSTSSEGLIAEDITYPDGEGGELMGYLARPEEAPNLLTPVIVNQEWWGLNEHIKDIARRFAQEGFVALAPDLYDGVVTTEPDEARKLVMELDTVEAAREIGQAADYLLQQEYVAGENVGVVGFCMGGGLALQTARIYEHVGASVAFYGRPLEPEQAAEVNVPVLGLYGAADESIPVDAVRTMEEAFAEAGIEHEFQIYEGAGHAFFNNTRDSYDADAAQDAWQRTLSWFRIHL
jgi:carboxymethylenebutenolidase